jgi:hypothetical protein
MVNIGTYFESSYTYMHEVVQEVSHDKKKIMYFPPERSVVSATCTVYCRYNGRNTELVTY